MTERDSTVVVTSDETLPEVIERVQGAASGGRTVDLVVPIDSSLLLTANEFRALNDAIDRDRLSVVLRTSDPLRLRLGERLGLRTRPLPRPRHSATVAAPTLEPSVAAPPSPLNRDTVHADDELALASPQVHDPTLHWPTANGAAELPGGDDASVAVPEPEARTAPANPPRRWLPVAAALALVVIAAFFTIRLVIPRAIVRIVPKTAPLEASLLFDVTPDGKPFDDQAAFAIKPEERQVDVVWEGSVPVTGVRAEPDGTASGPVELRNASGEAATVAAGTVIVTETGVEFAFVDDVTVPPLDPATGKPGAATGNVKAVKAGSSGMVGTGELGGRLPNGVYYSNRMQPTSGGTDKEFPVVAQADLDALVAQAKKAAPDLVAKTLGSDPDEASEAILSTMTITNQQNAFDHNINDDAQTVSLRSTLTVQVLAYDETAAETGYGQRLATSLAEAAPPGFALDPARITFDVPVEREQGADGFRLEVKAHALARAELDEAKRQALAAKLVGASADEATAILKQVPEIDSFTVEYEPTWLPRQMPKNTGRIELEMAQ